MPASWMSQRQEQIVDRVAGAGYRVARRTDDEIVMHRRRPSLSTFGILDSVVVVTTQDGPVTRADLVDREEGAVREALLLKIALPRGLFSAVEVFPVTLVDDADPDAIDFICGALRNRFAVLSMPAVVHGGGREVATFAGRKIWGGAYVRGMRRRVQAWVGSPD